MTTVTATPPLVCPPWCTTPGEEHARELADPLDGATFHRSEVIDAWELRTQHPLRVNVDICDDLHQGRREGPVINIDGCMGRGSQDYAELDPPDARRLAAALVEAADLVEQTPLAQTGSGETLVHFWVCTPEGRPVLSRLLCDAAAQRPADGSRMASAWVGVTCPQCLAAGPTAAEAIEELPDVALVALGAWQSAEGDKTVVSDPERNV
ncbi:hypothetical protein KVF89_11270 [Nocardioides carbamazepini]|jgi:hypothetical protein|uniref:DUF6907 domain-containing protein n=1 Tax=Nocardioides carbamazepini TaxID=2854259 RepID=UPI002149B7B6|nr:hypothetical protein [Nocardioides carbamazepini]MCR1783113.1 hypothetical protein [Nocardioides carbamazepini]